MASPCHWPGHSLVWLARWPKRSWRESVLGADTPRGSAGCKSCLATRTSVPREGPGISDPSLPLFCLSPPYVGFQTCSQRLSNLLFAPASQGSSLPPRLRLQCRAHSQGCRACTAYVLPLCRSQLLSGILKLSFVCYINPYKKISFNEE